MRYSRGSRAGSRRRARGNGGIPKAGPLAIPQLRNTADWGYAQYITALAGRGGHLGMPWPPYLHPDPPTAEAPAPEPGRHLIRFRRT